MATQLPFTNKQFNEHSLLGKLIYVASTIGTIAVAVIAISQASVYASDKFEDKVISLIKDNAYEAINIKVSDQLQSLKDNTARSQILQQISLNRMELRFIKSEISDITRNTESALTPSEQEDINQLRDDRNFLKDENLRLQEKLKAIDE